MTHIRRKIQVGFLLLAIMGLAAGQGFAGEQEDREITGVVATMQQMLKLTNAQVQEVTSVVREYFRYVKEAKADGINGQELQRKIKSLHDEMDAGLENYLTREQMALWKSRTARPPEAAHTSAHRKNSVLSAVHRHPSVVRPPAQDNDGVLQSGGTPSRNTTKTSGVW
jgi:hypothetical protein